MYGMHDRRFLLERGNFAFSASVAAPMYLGLLGRSILGRGQRMCVCYVGTVKSFTTHRIKK